MTFQERRKASRIHFRSKILIRSGEEATVATADSRDISLAGIYVKTTDHLPPGTRCLLNIDLQGDSSTLHFTVKGKVCRNDAHGMGIAFCDLSQDTFVHLKNLISLHSRETSSDTT